MCAANLEMSVVDEGRPDASFCHDGTAFEIDPLQDPRWTPFIEKHPGASVFHTVGWLQALKSCYGYVPRALSLTPPESPLENVLLFCEIRSPLTGSRLVSLPFSDHCEPLVNHPEEMDVFLANLRERVNRNRWKYLEIRPVLRTPSAQQNLGVSNTYYFHRLDLRPPEQLLLKNFHKDSVQRKIRRAERESLRYEEGSSDVLLDCFYKLLILTRRRQGLPPQPRKWFRSLVACMGREIKIRVALKGEIPVASILTISDKKTVVYKYGCSDARFNNLGGTALLFWNTIQQAKAVGIEELDMGRSDTDNPGLVTFKEHWGAKRSIVNYWRYPRRAAESRPEGRIRYAKRLVSIAPDAWLVKLGDLLYRHIG